MSQFSNESESSDGRPRKRGRPPSLRSTISTQRQTYFKKRRATLAPGAKSKPVIPITRNIVSLGSDSQLSSQQSSGNPYNDAICVICWMPFCIRHSVPAPRRQTQVLPKWILKRDDTKDSNVVAGRSAFAPCSHEGSCDPGNPECSCNEESVYCERFCCCPIDCPRRWKGCACKVGKPCTGEKCPCVRENRECEADLCLSCGADEQLDPIHRRPQQVDPIVASVVARSTPKEDIRAITCQNVFLQLDEPPMTKIGPTSMPFKGYGLFAMEPIKKGGFVGEYKGEVITGEEADRRVSNYDSSTSFLFTINSTHEIDGTQFGNKTRYLNHSKLEPNCEPRILLVNGIHRIAFNALEDIEPGQELLFNYGDTFFILEAVEREGALERGIIKRNLQRLKDARPESDSEGGYETPVDASDDQRLELVVRGSSRLGRRDDVSIGSRTGDKSKTRRSRLSRIHSSDDEFSDDLVSAQIQRERDM